MMIRTCSPFLLSCLYIILWLVAVDLAHFECCSCRLKPIISTTDHLSVMAPIAPVQNRKKYMYSYLYYSNTELLTTQNNDMKIDHCCSQCTTACFFYHQDKNFFNTHKLLQFELEMQSSINKQPPSKRRRSGMRLGMTESVFHETVQLHTC